MMNKKLNLNELKVSSFVTNIDKTNVETAKGGRPSITFYRTEAITCVVHEHSELYVGCKETLSLGC